MLTLDHTAKQLFIVMGLMILTELNRLFINPLTLEKYLSMDYRCQINMLTFSL